MSDRHAIGVSRRTLLESIGGAGALALAGCTETEDGNGDGLSGEVSIAGSSTVFPLANAVAERFAAEHPDVVVDVSRTGTGAGFSNFFCTGATDFNNASRPIRPAEEELCADNGVEYLELVVATDAVTVVVNNDADFVDCLTVEELARIWEADAVQTWDQVREGFPNEPITRFGPAATSGTYDFFIEHVQGTERGHTDDYQATEQDNQIATGVANNPYAIGYFGFAYYYNNPDQIKALAIDDGSGCVEPSLDTAASGEYQPLTRPLFTYVSRSSLAERQVAAFATFFVEQTTNESLVAEDVGYVPVTESTREEQLSELQAAIEEAGG